MGIIAPGLTSCVATTLLKVGLCQELSQRFVLEYIIKYQTKNISLIFLSNPKDGHKKEDHALVIIGSIQAPEDLYLGKNSGVGCVLNPNANQPINEFLTINKNAVIADPLLHCSGNIDSGLTPLFDYCKRYNLTHVIGVRSFCNTPYLVENAQTIKKNAVLIAENVNKLISNNKSVESSSQKKNHNTLAQTLFDNPEIKMLVKKYELPDSSQSSLEKGLRNAATNNKSEDLKLFIKFVNNINAQDSNPKFKRTALHWAAIKGHKICYEILIEAGANPEIRDAAGETAEKYLTNSISSLKNDRKDSGK